MTGKKNQRASRVLVWELENNFLPPIEVLAGLIIKLTVDRLIGENDKMHRHFVIFSYIPEWIPECTVRVS